MKYLIFLLLVACTHKAVPVSDFQVPKHWKKFTQVQTCEKRPKIIFGFFTSDDMHFYGVDYETGKIDTIR